MIRTLRNWYSTLVEQCTDETSVKNTQQQQTLHSRGREVQEKNPNKTSRNTKKPQCPVLFSCTVIYEDRSLSHWHPPYVVTFTSITLVKVLYWERGCHKWGFQGSATFLTPHSHSAREPTEEPSSANSQSGPSSMDLLSTQCSFSHLIWKTHTY